MIDHAFLPMTNSVTCLSPSEVALCHTEGREGAGQLLPWGGESRSWVDCESACQPEVSPTL